MIAEGRCPTGHRAPTEPPIVEIETEMIDTKKISRNIAVSEPGPPGRPTPVPGYEQGVEMSMEALGCPPGARALAQ